MKSSRKVLALLLALMMVLAFAACGPQKDPTPTPDPAAPGSSDKTVTPDEISDVMDSADGRYEIAMVTDLAQLKDKAFNQGTWEGVKTYAYEHGKSYKYYQPANGSEATDSDRYDAFIAAINNGAKIIVVPGYGQYNALYQAATEHPEVSFVFIDGWDVGLDNVAGIFYHEEQSGFMAGYACVKDGMTKLGYYGVGDVVTEIKDIQQDVKLIGVWTRRSSGGGGGSNPAISRSCYGFVQGANAAAAEMGVQVEMKISYLYGDSYSASDALQTQINGWYASGTEVVMSYGGKMCDSVFAAAAANNAYSIAGDVDQSGDSKTVITSALKGLGASVQLALSSYYDGNWDSIKGGTQLGIKEGAAGLPMATSRFETFSEADYEALVDAMISGELVVSADFEKFMAGEETFSNVTVNFIK